MSIPTPIDCKHGHLARSCEVCELERERDNWKEHALEAEKLLAQSQAEVTRLREALAVTVNEVPLDTKRLDWLEVHRMIPNLSVHHFIRDGIDAAIAAEALKGAGK